MKIFFFILIIINILLSAYWLFHGDIHYDIDVSRDFLVIDDIIRNHHLTLLGPRSGAIPGIFHGPLWFYVNLPIFFISGGNPLAIGWFWFILSVLFIVLVFWVTKKLFDPKIAILTALLLSVNSIINPTIGLKNFYNPYGAVFLFPLFFLLFYHYITTFKVNYLLLSLFTLGSIIQFQMAFGVPILIASTILLIYYLFPRKRIYHFLSYFILLIPLSTFILFDIKHNWLQIQAVLEYLDNGTNKIDFVNLIQSRLNAFIFNFFEMLSPGRNLFTIIFSFLFIIGGIIAFKKSTGSQKIIYKLFYYYLASFWVISLFFQGEIGNYFWPFLPLIIIIFCSYYNFVKKELFYICLIILYLINLYAGIIAIIFFPLEINQRGVFSWAFNQQIAKNIYEDAKEDFGYFCFSPDRYAFQQRYSMIYVQKYYPQIHAFSGIKKPLTYLIEVDPPKDRPELNSIGWRINDIKINRSANQTLRWDFIQVEKYFLNDKEVQIPINPYLSESLFLR